MKGIVIMKTEVSFEVEASKENTDAVRRVLMSDSAACPCSAPYSAPSGAASRRVITEDDPEYYKASVFDYGQYGNYVNFIYEDVP